MGIITYLNLINGIENKDTIKIIGKIDLSILAEKTGYSLCYSLPLVERMILEIFKLVPDSDVEHYEQGVMRTPISIIKKHKNILPDNTISIIEDIYGDDGIRNMCFHVNNTLPINIPMESFDKINFLIMQLLSILRDKIKENSGFRVEDIEFL